MQSTQKKRWLLTPLIGIYLFLLGIACQNLLEQDISDQMVVLNSPPDQMHSDNYNQTFWWNKVDGATTYNLQVVSPSFENIKRLVLDTNLSSNQFIYSFYPDTFTWRVKAYNPASETQYTYATFYIDSTQGPQIPVLNKPGNNYITNDSLITFSWFKAANASNYRIMIKEGDDIVSGIIVYETSVTYPNTTLGTQLLEDGEYTWTVKAENEVGASEYASNRNIWIDRTKPETPVILKPTAGDTIDSFDLAWKRGTNTGSAILDSLIVYRDSSGTDILLDIATTDTLYNYTGATDSKWYRFKVKSMDAAGNESGWSALRYFYYAKSDETKKK
jgi:hypothetical protein